MCAIPSMGIIGKLLGGFLGGKLGGAVGGDKGKMIGSGLGGALGTLVPFKKGGPVRRKTKALLHKGEYVLPKGVKPTKAQLKKMRRKRK